MKNREGDTPHFATAFQFTPVRINEVELIEEGDDSTQTTDDTTGYVL
jgi:hypothetical protein